MLKKQSECYLAIVLVLLLVLLLIGVRVYEDELFYDPFLNYFKTDFKTAPLPPYNALQLFLGLVFRYALNMLFSMGLLYVVFKEIAWIKFAAFLYVFFFMVLVFWFYLLVSFWEPVNTLGLFYVRRFLIQPLFVLLFIPAFYYQKTNK
ncbi:exosortase F system-associated membrane protein [Flavobacterium crassostreae]|uniref:Exosortase F system-associated protein n=1 Tax=Flavobacterium crassostreae TaxID=1763534 RepID=A0A1B9DXS7_9FLAO|nr:exosortase F system-associated protein [Flavobacterium crassostreae]OCB74486.1 exosortase F system-associated protein [Flavobacterium crassostreae]